MNFIDLDSEPERRKFLIPWVTLGLAAIIVIAAFLRLTGLDWDEKAHLHPDERFLTMVETAIQPTFSISEYFSSSTSSLNPRNRGHTFFVYGSLPIFFVRYAAEIADQACASFPGCTLRFIGYDQVYLVGRAISALADLATVLVLFFIGRRLYSQWAGLIAASLYAVAVLPIQHSHFFTVEAFLVLMVSVAFYYAIRISQDGGWSNYVCFGLFFGGALACKISVWPMGFILAAAVLIKSSRSGEQNWMGLYAGLAIAVLAAFFAFRVFQPYAFTGINFNSESMGEESFQAAVFNAPPWWRTAFDALPSGVRAAILPSPRWLANMESIRGQMSGDVDFPPNHQWTDRKPIIFPWINMVLYGMGPLLGVTAWIGWAAAIIQMAVRRFAWRRHALPVLWIFIFFSYQGTQWVKSMRYFLPIYPMLILLAGWFLVELIQQARAQRLSLDRVKIMIRLWRSIFHWAPAALLALVVAATSLWAFAFVEIYRQPTTRVAASRWVYQNVPMGASLLYQPAGGGLEEVLQAPIPLMKYDYVVDGQQNATSFVMPQDGAAVGIRFNYLSDPVRDVEEEILHVSLSADPAGNQQLASALLIEDLQTAHNDRGDPYQLSWAPVLLQAGQRYFLTTELLSGAPIRTTGAYIVNETSWDDGLPLRQDGLDGFSIYEGDPLELYWEDDESKRERLIELLDRGEYLFITSSRQLGSIPRITPRYPLTIAYYQALFNKELGYELEATFFADFKIGPIRINDVFGKLGWEIPPQVGWPPPGDLAAEEAFSVYDHPPVWIFKKTDDYSAEKTRAVLESVDLSQRRVVIPYDYTQELRAAGRPEWLAELLGGSEDKSTDLEPYANIWLSPGDQAQQQAGGTWSQIVDTDGLLSKKPALGAVVWWITVLLLGWLVWPLVSVALGGLPSKGYAVSKIFALLSVAWVAWMATSLKLVTYDRRTIWLAIGVIAFFSTIAAFFRRSELGRFIRKHWRFMLVVEALGIVLFVISLLIRSGNPDLWHPSFGGEKPMDFAFLNAVIKSATFPPYDPWLSGAAINYYYFGFVLLGNLIKLLRIMPHVAYNLALPMLFSLTGLGAFSLAFDLVAGDQFKRQPEIVAGTTKPNRLMLKAVQAGLFAAVIVVLLGNLGQAWTLVNGWNKLGRLNTGPESGWLEQTGRGLFENLKASPLPIYTGSWYWDATRIIPPDEGEAGPITEFPFFTYLYGDLHAHMIDMPLVLLALAWALALAQSADRFRGWRGRQTTSRVIIQFAIVWFAGGLCIGALRAVNTWDWPAMLGVGSVAIFYSAWRVWRRTPLWIAAAGIGVTALFGLNSLLFLPYTSNFVPAYTQVMKWEGGVTPFWAFFAVQGLFIFILITQQLIEFRNWTKRLTDESLAAAEPYAPLIGLAVLLVLAGMVVLLWLKAPIGLFIFIIMVVAGLLALQPQLYAERKAVMMLFTLGLAMILAVELVVLSGDISRMNTVFKFYLQVWLIFSAVSGAALVWIGESIRKWKAPMRKTWTTMMWILVFMAALYPPTAARAKIEDRFNPGIRSNGEPVESYVGLDGMAYMKTAVHHDKDQAIPLVYDYEAIRWIQDNVQGSPVIMEANTYPKIYGWGNRISIYTGLPSVVGWEWHTRQHRAGFDGATEIVRQRANEVILFYNTSDIDLALDILEHYDVQLIIVGKLEQAYYSAKGLAKFDIMAESGMIKEVYRNPGAVIYKVVTGGSD